MSSFLVIFTSRHATEQIHASGTTSTSKSTGPLSLGIRIALTTNERAAAKDKVRCGQSRRTFWPNGDIAVVTPSLLPPHPAAAARLFDAADPPVGEPADALPARAAADVEAPDILGGRSETGDMTSPV